MADIVCVGYACADVFIRGADFQTPFTTELKLCESTMLAVGGDAANEAIVMGRLGVDVRLLAGIGDDGVGDFIENTVAAAGVDTGAFHRTPNSPSAMTIVVVHPDGQRNFISAAEPPASALFEPDLSQLQGAKIVSLGSIFVTPLVEPEQVLRVVKAARENGANVCADVVSCNGGTLESLREALKHVDYIFPNYEEAEAFTGKKDLDEMADCLLGYGIGTVVIKTGADGCFLKNRTERFKTPIISPKGVVDTTGAGDNFAAGFMTALSEGKNLRDCCRFASATAGVACQFVGSNTGVKSRQQVEDFLKQYG